jgi:hypothetical protein
MSLSAIIDVAIVLTAIYVSLSCLCSWIQEQIAAALRLRGEMLYRGILNLVFGHPEVVERIFSHPLVTTGVKAAPAGAAPSAAQPQIVSTLQSILRTIQTYRPSYVDARNFSVAFWQSISETQNPPLDDVAPLLVETPMTLLEDLKGPVNALAGPYPNLHKTCLALIAQSQGDYQKLLSTTDGWFEAQMDRVTGWYKRQAQFILIAIALLVVSFTGIDSIEVAKRLYLDPEMRTAIVQPVVDTVQSAAASPPPSLQQPSPAGGPPAVTASAAQETAVAQTLDQVLQSTSLAQITHLSLNPFSNWPHHTIGMILTLIALSLGGPFWFDLLSLFVNVRATGRRPDRSDQPAR